MNLQAGDMIGAYQIVSPLGQGGMATVYKAYHERLDRHVAIKLMHTTFLQDEDFRARFQREARIVARLENPYVVPVYDYNEHEGTPYLVMKFITGMTLKKRAIKTGLTLEETYSYLSRIAEGMDYAHRQGILHRDMKPSNILIDSDDHPYIADFGLARIAEAGASTISHDMMLGTPFYISPEQAQGKKDLDNRTDIYSMGIILYELITGQVPFQADTPIAIVHGHIYSMPKPPSEVNPELNERIDAVLEKALAKDPQARYGTASAMMRAFAEAMQTVDTPAAPSLVQVTPAKAKNPSRYDDLGNEYLMEDRKTIRDKSPNFAIVPPKITGAPMPPQMGKVKIDGELDLGDVNWSELGDKFRSGVTSLAEMIEDRIDTELRERRGIELTDEELVRRRVVKRVKARSEFIRNLSSYITVNGFLVVIWLFTGANFFWPIFPIIFWGMGVVGQGVDYYSKFGPGARQEEDLIQQEYQRELDRIGSGVRTTLDGKAKRLTLDDLDEGNGRVRLTDEGELTDSFINEQRQRR